MYLYLVTYRILLYNENNVNALLQYIFVQLVS